MNTAAAAVRRSLIDERNTMLSREAFQTPSHAGIDTAAAAIWRSVVYL